MAYRRFPTRKRYDPIADARKEAVQNGKAKFDKNIWFDKDHARAIRFDAETSEIVFKLYLGQFYVHNGERGEIPYHHELRIPSTKDVAFAFMAEEARASGCGTYMRSVRGLAANKRYDKARGVHLADGMDYEFTLARKDSKPEMFRVDGANFTRFEKNSENRWVKAEVQPEKSELIIRVDGLKAPPAGSTLEAVGEDPTGRRINLRVMGEKGGEGLKQALSGLEDGKSVEFTMLAYHTDYTDMLSGKPSAEAIVDEAGILSARSIAPVSVKSPDWINSQDMIIERKDLQTGGTLVVIKDKSNPFLRLAANNAEIRDRFLEAIPAGETLSEVKGSEKVVLQNGRLFQIRTVEGFREPQRKIAPRTAEAAR